MVIATNNKGKIEEFKKLFQNKKIYSLKDKNIDIEIEENQDTFIENAKKKAMEIYEIVKEETIADDSGLCVKCLNDFPGVMTHRFLGEEATDRMRNEYLIKETNKYEDRSAQMVCAIVYYNGDELIVSEGKLDGYISKIGHIKTSSSVKTYVQWKQPNGLLASGNINKFINSY